MNDPAWQAITPEVVSPGKSRGRCGPEFRRLQRRSRDRPCAGRIGDCGRGIRNCISLQCGFILRRNLSFSIAGSVRKSSRWQPGGCAMPCWPDCDTFAERRWCGRSSFAQAPSAWLRVPCRRCFPSWLARMAPPAMVCSWDSSGWGPCRSRRAAAGAYSLLCGCAGSFRHSSFCRNDRSLPDAYKHFHGFVWYCLPAGRHGLEFWPA